jgi:hypothetical protein
MEKYSTVSFQSLDSGKYLVQSYDAKVVRTDKIAYIINAKFNNKDVEFWADRTLSNYIKTREPEDEFEIIINRDDTKEYPNSVIIPGFTTKVILKSRSTK